MDFQSAFDPAGRHRTNSEATLRVGDAERQRTVDRLATAHGLGQLDLAEFDERTTKAWTAKTAADLDALTFDLPTPATEGSARGGSMRSRLGSAVGAPWAALGAVRVVLGVLLALMIVGFVLGHLFFILPWVVLWLFMTGRFGRGRPAFGPRSYGRRY